MSRQQSSGNGCLYALLGVGVLMVGAAIALEAMPDEWPAEEPEAPPPVPRWYQPPPAPEEPPPPPPAVDPLAEVQEILGDVGEPTRTLMWHAEAPGEPPVACVLRVDATAESRRPSGAIALACADGRRFAGNVSSGQLTGVRVAGGVAFRADLPTVSGSDGDGYAATLRVNTHQHELVIEGATTLPGRLFVEELSVTDALTTVGLGPSPVTTRVVRLAVPTLVTGDIPASIAMVRATGPAPRPGDPVCELVASPAISSLYSCRVVVRCHGETIYGAGTTGYNDCQIAESAVLTASDTGTTPENSDPRLELDVARGTLLVADDDEGGSWSATFQLLVDPRLGADLDYQGGYRGDASGSWSIRPFGTPATMTFDEVTEPLAATGAQLGRGQYTIAAGGVPGLPFTFGRNGRSIAGYAQDRAVWGFATL